MKACPSVIILPLKEVAVETKEIITKGHQIHTSLQGGEELKSGHLTYQALAALSSALNPDLTQYKQMVSEVLH